MTETEIMNAISGIDFKKFKREPVRLGTEDRPSLLFEKIGSRGDGKSMDAPCVFMDCEGDCADDGRDEDTLYIGFGDRLGSAEILECHGMDKVLDMLPGVIARAGERFQP